MQELPDSLESSQEAGAFSGENRRISGSVIKQALNLPDGWIFHTEISELPAKNS
ncbi:hypothetical protein [Methanosarcina sp. MSH10X1]|uniref:hypothetical protein n=1 Tax=Methanosarcina sp. MSH10X1 TaxID=2507075 RepID=UPI0013E40C49|nr:hypothetical protein [Methanosarcina sp. MSH10X1]